ncbi:hypothetical protein PUR34_19250 [Streptomyces sp. JV185]|uniref:hypothetical protein n=1 Tax=Streptomyces sp. JV185 TaxID=858638 RepID=UPI002E75F68B|nr:hypothetical protein [Streptomyces sp. JV185]MEE1770220.1 hypothetical protein [Streptomyces sp. JV185]
MARGEVVADAVHPRTASVPMLCGEYVLHSLPEVPDAVLTEIVDEIFLPLVRGRANDTGKRTARPGHRSGSE